MLRWTFSRGEERCSREETSIVQCHRGPDLQPGGWLSFCLVGVHVYGERRMETVGLVEFITLPDS